MPVRSAASARRPANPLVADPEGRWRQGGERQGREASGELPEQDGLLGVTRGTVRKLAAELNLKETQVVHLAFRRLADSVLPAYEPDDGPLSDTQLAAIRRFVGRQKVESVSSTLL